MLTQIYASLGHNELTHTTYYAFEATNRCIYLRHWQVITLTPYMMLPLFATRFADYAGGILVSFTQPRLF